MKGLILTYKTTPISVRESVAFTNEEASVFLLKVKESFRVSDLLLISTCNRTELYYNSDDEIADKLVSLIASEKGLVAAVLKQNFKFYDDLEAINHLFRVSLGLESKVLGDIQISNQIKRAYQLSADLDLAGSTLHRLMHTIFFANKRVVQETGLQDGNASVAAVTAGIIKAFNLKFKHSKIAIIGLGEIGQNLLENISDINDAEILLSNRTLEKTEILASKKGFRVVPFEQLDHILDTSDIIVSCVSTGKPIITPHAFSSKSHHKLIIDLSMPRSVDPDIENIPGISLYNIDQLEEKTQKAKKIREKAIPDVEAIIADSIAGFNEWKDEMEVSPTIQKLKSALEDIRKKELSKYLNKASETDRELLEVVTKNMVQKLIKLPILRLKVACKRGEADSLVEVLNDLFDLEKEHISSK